MDILSAIKIHHLNSNMLVGVASVVIEQGQVTLNTQIFLFPFLALNPKIQHYSHFSPSCDLSDIKRTQNTEPLLF